MRTVRCIVRTITVFYVHVGLFENLNLSHEVVFIFHHDMSLSLYNCMFISSYCWRYLLGSLEFCVFSINIGRWGLFVIGRSSCSLSFFSSALISSSPSLAEYCCSFNVAKFIFFVPAFLDFSINLVSCWSLVLPAVGNNLAKV